MEGFEILKQTRIEHGYTIDELSSITGIKPRSLRYYECGEKSLNSLMVYTVLELFAPLDISPEDFFDRYFHYKEECDIQISNWKKEHPKILDYSSLRHLSYDRIAHLKYRDTISEKQYLKLMGYYQTIFNYLSALLNDRNTLTEKEYDIEYLDFMYNAKRVLYGKDNLPDPLNDILRNYFRSEYVSQTFSFLPKEFATLIGYSMVSNLRKILAGELPLDKLSIIAALKLCYVLELEFPQIFYLGEKT